MTNCVYPGTIVFLAGLLAGINFGYPALLCSAAVSIAGMAVWLWKRSLAQYVLLLLTVCAFGAVGIISGAHIPPEPQQLLQSCFNREVTAYGIIDPATVKHSDKGTSFVLKCYGIIVDGKTLTYTDKVRVFSAEKIKQYDKYVYCRGILQQLSNFRNPGGFDAEKWNYVNGIGGMLSKGQVTVTQQKIGWSDKAALLNLALKERIMHAAGSSTGGLLAGMVFGGSSNIDDDTRKIFTDNGLTHILSVSGTHMVLLTGFLLLILRRLQRKLRCIIIAVMLILYGAMCGFQPPVLRALCMSIILLYGGSMAEKGIILCMTGIVMLIFKPVWIYDIGFQLSFGAAAGLIWLLPKIKAALSAYMPLWLSEAVGVTIAAQLAVLPLLINYFYQLSLISVLSNIILVPVLEIATIMTLLGLLLSLVPTVGDGLICLAGFFTQQVIVQGKLLSYLPGSVVTIGAMPLWSAAVYYFLLSIWMDLPCVQFLQNKERQLFIGALSMFLVVGWGIGKYGSNEFAVYFLDVGQGDCAVITTPDNKVAVIDTGGLKNYDTGSRILVPFLHRLGTTKIDVLLLSHGDYDHAGGAAGLAKYIEIDKIILSDIHQCTAAEKQLLAGTSAKEEQAAAGAVYALGNDAALKILDTAPPGTEGNDASIVAAAEYGGHRVIFTGDISEEREALLLDIGKADVLKVAHHGSRFSSSDAFLAQVQPALAVISAGLNNSYGHPHAETLDRLQAMGCQIMRTDLMGAVKVTFDGNTTKCYSYVYQKEYF